MSGMPSPDIADVGTMLTYLRPHGALWSRPAAVPSSTVTGTPHRRLSLPASKPQAPTHAPHMLCIMTLHPQGWFSKRDGAPRMPRDVPR